MRRNTLLKLLILFLFIEKGKIEAYDNYLDLNKECFKDDFSLSILGYWLMLFLLDTMVSLWMILFTYNKIKVSPKGECDKLFWISINIYFYKVMLFKLRKMVYQFHLSMYYDSNLVL